VPNGNYLIQLLVSYLLMSKIFRWETCNECPFVELGDEPFCSKSPGVEINLDGGPPPDECPMEDDERGDYPGG